MIDHSISDDPIADAVHAARRRIRILRLLRHGSVSVGCGSIIALVAVGMGKLRLIPSLPALAVVTLLAISALIGILVALFLRLPDLEVARLTEQRADLKERLSSALEFRREVHDTEPFYALQLADASHHAAAVDMRALYPIRLPRAFWFAVPAVLALCLVYLLNIAGPRLTKQQKAEAAEVKVRGIQIIKLALDTKKAAEQQKLPETLKAAEEVRKLGEAMHRNKVTKKESLVSLEKLTRKMEQRQQELARQQAPKSLEQAGKELKKSMDEMQKEAAKAERQRAQDSKQNHAAQKPGTRPQDMGRKDKESEAMKQAKAAMQQMQQALKQQNPQAAQQAMQRMAQTLQKGGLSKQEMQQMAQMMQQMAQAMQGTQMQQGAQQAQQIAQMMQGANTGDAQQMQSIAAMMRQMANGMGKASQMAQAAFDARALGNLIGALKAGRMTVPGSGMGPGQNGYGRGQGGMGRGGWGGTGVPSKPMKDPGITKPRLLVKSPDRTTDAAGKNGSLTAFQKYLAQPNKAGKYLPNGQIKGSRSQNGQELSMQTTGDPGAAQSNTPYYQAVETSRKQAESVLSKESVPATMKKQVHDYFETLHEH